MKRKRHISPLSFVPELIFCALISSCALLYLSIRPGSPQSLVIIDSLFLTIGPAGLLLFCLYRGMCSWKQIVHLRPVQQWSLGLLYLYLGFFSLGEGAWAYANITNHPLPTPSIADVSWLNAYLVMLVFILLLPARALDTSARVRTVLDGLMIMISVIAFSWYFILGPTILQSHSTLLVTIVDAAYPFSDLVLFSCLLLLSFRSIDRKLSTVLRLLSLALAVIMITDSFFDYQVLQGSYATGELVDVGWLIGILLVGFALLFLLQSVCRIEGDAAVPVPFPSQSLSVLWKAFVPYALVPLVIVLTVFVSTHADAGNLSLTGGVYLSAAILIGLILLRQVFAVRETVASAQITQHLNAQLQTTHQEISEKNARLEALATTDPLTELPNHRALLECLEKETASARRHGYPFSILFFDGDHFKRVNDTYGHSVGDAVLQELGRRGRESLRGGDTLGRYGGEEFMVLLPQTNVTQAGEVAERMRVAMAVSPLVPTLVPGGVALTISIGVATFPVDGQTASEVVDRADQAMYWAKRLGRNQIRTALEAQRASQDSALAATILNLERREAPSLDGLNVEQSVRANQLSTIQSLMGLLDSRDQGISVHSYQVSDLAGAIARERGKDRESVFAISTAALLHDIGKIALPDMLLQKAGMLSSQEWEFIRHHPEFGAQILEVSPYLHHLMPAVHHHHENWDGTGYPDGLAGEAIPLAARIIRVAEACSAMMSRRAYQAERSSSATCSELQRCAGRQFDPEIVQAALTILGRTEEEAIADREERLVF